MQHPPPEMLRERRPPRTCIDAGVCVPAFRYGNEFLRRLTAFIHNRLESAGGWAAELCRAAEARAQRRIISSAVGVGVVALTRAFCAQAIDGKAAVMSMANSMGFIWVNMSLSVALKVDYPLRWHMRVAETDRLARGGHGGPCCQTGASGKRNDAG